MSITELFQLFLKGIGLAISPKYWYVSIIAVWIVGAILTRIFKSIKTIIILGAIAIACVILAQRVFSVVPENPTAPGEDPNPGSALAPFNQPENNR